MNKAQYKIMHDQLVSEIAERFPHKSYLIERLNQLWFIYENDAEETSPNPLRLNYPDQNALKQVVLRHFKLTANEVYKTKEVKLNEVEKR